MKVEFECILCGRTATATVSDDTSDEGPMRTLRDCPTCGMETIWLAF